VLLRFLNRRVEGDIVRLIFNRKGLHFLSPNRRFAAVITSITQAGNTSKRIVQELAGESGSATPNGIGW
jgi:hypothetical protein